MINKEKQKTDKPNLWLIKNFGFKILYTFIHDLLTAVNTSFYQKH